MTNMNMSDNMICLMESFRENGLNTLEPGTLVNRSRLETLLASLYSSLNKRLPPGQSIDIEKTSCMLSTWLMFTYCSDDSGRLRVFSVKIAMAVLSCGKLMDKFRYMFSQLTDCNGHLSPRRYVERNFPFGNFQPTVSAPVGANF